MNAQEIVEILLEADLAPSRLVLFHRIKFFNGFSVSSLDGKSAMIRMLNRVFHVDPKPDQAMDFINQMLDHGYSIVLRNQKGSHIVYTSGKRLYLSKETARKTGEFLGISPTTIVYVTPHIEPDARNYKKREAADVIVGYDKENRDTGEPAKDRPSATKRYIQQRLAPGELDPLGGIDYEGGLAFTP